VFSGNRRKIREVDVEVVTPGDSGAIAPAGGDNGAFNGHEPPASAERPSTTEGEPLLSSVFLRGFRRVRPEDGTEPPGIETEQETIEEITPTAPTAETEAQPHADHKPLGSEPRVDERIQHPPADASDTPAIETVAHPSDETEHETIEEITPTAPTAETEAEPPADDKPLGSEPQVEERIDSPAAATRRATTRVVWKSSLTPTVQRAHTLKLTKPTPTTTNRAASVQPANPVASPPAQRPRAAEPPRIERTVEERPVAQDTPVTDPVTTPNTSAPPAADVPGEATPATPEPRAEQMCDILFWRGYRKAAFYGRTFDETGEPVAVAESPFFRPQGNGAPEPTEAAKAAYEALRSELIAAGWEPVAAGDDWFDETFRATAAAEPGPE